MSAGVGAPVNALEVLRAVMSDCRGVHATNQETGESFAADLAEVHAALTEWLEAEAGYDAAAFNYNADTATDEQCERLGAAARRRQAARARVQGRLA